jgi:predicted DNA binding protein
MILPPDKISVQSLRGEEKKGWSKTLTNRQCEVLSHAVRRGYYKLDCDITLRELAEELGMARSTLGEHLQRAEQEIMKEVVEDMD